MITKRDITKEHLAEFSKMFLFQKVSAEISIALFTYVPDEMYETKKVSQEYEDLHKMYLLVNNAEDNTN